MKFKWKSHSYFFSCMNIPIDDYNMLPLGHVDHLLSMFEPLREDLSNLVRRCGGKKEEDTLMFLGLSDEIED